VTTPIAFADRLAGLRAAAGTPSYERVAAWTKTLAQPGGTPSPGRSTVHEWLTGAVLPPQWEPLELVLTALIEKAQGRGTPEDPKGSYQLRVWKQWYDKARAAAAVPAGPVYQGLAAYGEADSARFFGRADDIDRLRERLDETHRCGGLLVVLGPSGVGKSSVLAAGLIPVLATRGLPSTPGASSWPATVITPGSEPLQALAAAVPPLAAVLSDDRIDPATVRAAVAEHTHATRPQSRQQTSSAVPERQAGASGNGSGPAADTGTAKSVLIVDQFEEVFQADLRARARFIDVLVAAATASGTAPAPALVVLSCRDDFYPQLRGVAQLTHAMDRPAHVDPMTIEQLTDAITGPAKIARKTLEPALLTHILHDAGVTHVNGEPTGATIGGQLPLISHALRVMSDRGALTSKAYNRAGGVAGAVRETADQAWRQLRAEGLDGVALEMLIRLVRVDADRHDTRLRLPKAALLAAVSHAGTAGRALTILSDARLVTATGASVEITHDALLREWQQLRDAIDSERADLSLRQDIERRARQWDDAHRPPDRLYRGTELLAARRVASKHRVEDKAQEFLAAAGHQERRQVLRRRLLMVASATTAGVILASAVGLFVLWRAGQQREQDAVFENVVAQADRMHGSDLSVEALLDVAAYRTRPTSYLYTKLVETEGEALSSSLRGHRLAVNGVAWNPRGTVVASASADHTLRLWSATDPGHRQLGATLALHRTDVDSVAWSPDGRVLASGGDDGTIYLWGVADPHHVGALGPPLTLSGGVNALAFSPDGRTLAAGTRSSGMVYLYHVSDPAHPTPIGPPLSATSRAADSVDANAVSFSPDGRVLASADDDGTAQLWNVSDPAHPTPLGGPIIHPAGVNSTSFSPDGRILATGCADHTLRLWDVSSPAHPALLGLQTAGSGPVLGVAYSPDGHTVATSDDDHKVRLWDVADPTRPGPEGPELLGHTGPVWKVAWSPDGHTLASGSEDGDVRLWAIPTVVNGHTSTVTAVAFSRHLVASGGDDHTVRFWHADPDDPTALGSPLFVGGAVTALALSRDGQLLAVASDNDSIGLYNIANPAHPTPIGPPMASTETATLALSPDGRALATTSNGSIVRLYDLSAARSVAFSPSGHDLAAADSPGGAAAVAWSPDGRTLAASADDNSIRLYNVTDLSHPTPIGHPLLGHIRSVRALAFTRDGRTLASAGDDDSVRLWDTSDPSNAHAFGQPLTDSTSAVNTVAWSPDGRTLASGGNDDSVRLWDTSDRSHPSALGAPLTAHTDAVRAVAFNPAGSVLASAGRDATMRLWNLDVNEVIHRICVSTANAVGPTEWSRLFPNVPFDQPCKSD
jgi:WD40 repeat protein